MAYTPLNLQNGQVLTAEDLQHMEQGILANELPPSTNFQQLVTDGSGNVGWADRLAYDNQITGVLYNTSWLVFDQYGSVIVGENRKLRKFGEISSDVAETMVQYGVVITTPYKTFSCTANTLTNGAYELVGGPSPLLIITQPGVSVDYRQQTLVFDQVGVYVEAGGTESDDPYNYTTGELKQINPVLLPTGVVIAGQNNETVFQQLVTDGSGTIGWAKQPFYSENVVNNIYDGLGGTTTFTRQKILNSSWYLYTASIVLYGSIEAGNTYQLRFNEDGTSNYKTINVTANNDGIGNANLADDGYSFNSKDGLYYIPAGNSVVTIYWVLDSAVVSEFETWSFTLEITQNIEIVTTINPKFLATTVNFNTLTKSKAMTYAQFQKRLSGTKGSVSDGGTLYAFVDMTISPSQSADECSGCGAQSAQLSFVSSGTMIESFDLTDGEYNQIASAWGLS